MTNKLDIQHNMQRKEIKID